MHKKIILLISFLITLSYALTPILIPKILWTYIASSDTMTTLQSLCIGNLRRYAKQSGYAFKLVTNDNYTTLFKQWSEVSALTNSSHLYPQITMEIIIKLKILQEYGGVWIDSNVMLVQPLSWLEKTHELPYTNNQINDPEVILFYEPYWLDKTERKKTYHQEDVVITPYYLGWFIAVSKANPFIKAVKKQFSSTVSRSYEVIRQQLAKKDIETDTYLEDQHTFLPWLLRSVITLKQQQFDNQNLAVKEYKITAIDSTRTANILNSQAHNRANLVSKYLAEMTINQLPVQLHLAVKIDKTVEQELLETLDQRYLDLSYLYQTVTLVCDNQTIPFKYILKESVIQKYLIDNNEHHITVYEQDYVRHRCHHSYLEVYSLLGKYIFFLGLFIANVIITRKALLILKPEWGVRKRVVEFQQSDL